MTNPTEPFSWKSPSATGAHAYLWPAVRDLLADHLDATDATIVDVGCGNGFVAGKLLGEGYTVFGFDASEDGVEIARERHPEGEFKVASLYDDDVPVDVEDADAVVSLEVIEHLYRPDVLFEQARRILSPEGVLVLSTPYHGYIKNLAISVIDGWDNHFSVDHTGGHIKFFSQSTLREMGEAHGFRMVAFKGAGRFPFMWKSMLAVFVPRDRSTE